MVASTDIKFYVHTNNNAPQLQNAYGSMINVLDACLVGGINIGAISSLTASGKTVTATFGSAHNLMQYQVIKITGANQSEFNSEHRILTVPNAQSVTFELAAMPSVTTATGTITASLPPLGWEKPFSNSNPNGGGKAAYRSLNLLLPSRPFLRVVDELDPAYTATYAKYAKVGIVEDMTDIGTMLGVQAPFDAVNPDKNWVGVGSGTTATNGWAKWYYAVKGAYTGGTTTETGIQDVGNRAWILVGSLDYFYVFPADMINGDAFPYGFGSFSSILSADNSNNFLSSTLSYNTASQGMNKPAVTGLNGTATSQKLVIQRGYSQVSQHVQANTISLGVAATVYTGASEYTSSQTLAGSTLFSPVFIKEDIVRGSLNNIYWLFQLKPYQHMRTMVDKDAIFMAINVASTVTSGQLIVKIGDLV